MSEPVAFFLQSGRKKLSSFYHPLKTHKIPENLDNPNDWLNDNYYPLQGIISGQGTPTERLEGFVHYFLQPGMKELPSFLYKTQFADNRGDTFEN